jgi:peptidoglycan/LPS O-acetylase OafA/YrhL
MSSNEDKSQSLTAKPVTTLALNSEYQLSRAIPQLDRLRGLAILLVLICHAASVLPDPFAGLARQGWVGVDLFFVLSGFLITGILWDTRESKRYFGRFYGRRVLRIWPVYLLLLTLAFLIIHYTLREGVAGQAAIAREG